ncbi:uncharacterized protein At5g39865 [Amaranthus tricolor]|uniref:uncharacterized protein At5g39865 n=1 Tax=Amaranthus tricolor TaxID=29722 RepID=UPI002583AC42|nr:uncharacterized protein At5g39865 [Amaranthus tricolor]
MGCSASKFDTLLAKAIEDPSFSLTSHTSSSSSSTSNSFASTSSSSSIPKPRSFSAPLVHHPAVKKGDSHHLVSLTSSTYGSLILVDTHPASGNNDGFSGHSSPDSVINTWELMEGLEEEEEKGFNNHDSSGNDLRLKSLNSCDLKDVHKIPTLKLGLNFTDSIKKLSDSYVFVEMPQRKVEDEIEELNSNLNSKPLWQLLSEESLLSKMDPNVASSYQKALSSKKLGCNSSNWMNDSVDLSPCVTKSKSVESSSLVSKSAEDCNIGKVVSCEDKIVLYFTSLRGIRKTYEDCCTVRLILRGFRVMVDEKDISMDSSYRKELQSALCGKAFSLPQLFVRGKHIGGADVVKEMHESGELERLLDGFPIQDCGFACEMCGDARFVPCSNCNGSRKIFLEEEGQTRRCPDCNENGLVRCPGCCS